MSHAFAKPANELPNPAGAPQKFGDATDYVEVHNDGTGLMNNAGLDRMQLSDEEEFELVDLLDFGLNQPRDVPYGSVFAFTKDGMAEHSRLLELLTKASKTGVKMLELDPKRI